MVLFIRLIKDLDVIRSKNYFRQKHTSSLEDNDPLLNLKRIEYKTKSMFRIFFSLAIILPWKFKFISLVKISDINFQLYTVLLFTIVQSIKFHLLELVENKYFSDFPFQLQKKLLLTMPYII